ncbi:16764_t:CDS:2, partial [Racocetra persica]
PIRIPTFYFHQYEEVFKKYKTSLENIKEFAKEIANIEKNYHFFYPYRHVKEKYERLIKEHENCEKKLNPILIKVIMNKQESQYEDFKKINEILKTIPTDDKNDAISKIETIVEDLLKSSSIDVVTIPRIDSSLLLDPPLTDDVDQACELFRGPCSYLDDDAPMRNIVRKVFKRGVEVVCEPLYHFEKNKSILSELKRCGDSRNILKFYGLSNVNENEMLVFEWAGLGSLRNVYQRKKISWDLKVKIARDICQGLIFLSHVDIFHRDLRCENIAMTYYMEPKITNFYLAKHASEIGLSNDHISEYISSIINWAAPEMMQENHLYTRECEVFSFVMLLWEMAFQRMPYKDKSEEEIRTLVTQNRRESPDPPFYSLDFLNIQRKYLRVIAEGWNGKPEKRIKMDDILLKFLDIETELTKPKRNNSSCSANSSDQLDQLTSPNSRVRTYSSPPNPNQRYKKYNMNLHNSNRSILSRRREGDHHQPVLTDAALAQSPTSFCFPDSADEQPYFNTQTPRSASFASNMSCISSTSDDLFETAHSTLNISYQVNDPSTTISNHKVTSPPPMTSIDESDEISNSTVMDNSIDNVKEISHLKSSNASTQSIALESSSKDDVPKSLVKDDISKPYDISKPLNDDDISKPYDISQPLNDDDISKPLNDDDNSKLLSEDDGTKPLDEDDKESDNDEPSEAEAEDERVKPSVKPKAPSVNIPSSINKNLGYASIIKSQNFQYSTTFPCATPKPKMRILDTKFQAKLIVSSKSKDSFLLENNIDSLAIDVNHLDWVSNADPLISKSQANDIYLELKCIRAEIIFEKGSMKPNEILIGAIDRALDQKNPYRELLKVFEQFGHFLPKKLILGDKLNSMTKNSSTQKSSDSKININKEIKTIDDFSKKTGDYNDILKQWGKLSKSSNTDSLSLTSINGKSVKGSGIKDWAIASLKSGPDSWNIIGWEGLYPIYEILDEDMSQDVKLFLGNDEQTIQTKIKEKILRSGSIPIEGSDCKFPVKFDSPLESKNYQIFGRIMTQNGSPLNNANVKFVSKEKTGFLAIIDIFSAGEPPNNLQIVWVLIGIPAEIGIYDANTRNISILSAGKCPFTPKTKDTGVESCDVQLKTLDVLQPNAVLITSFKYPKLSYKQYYMAKVKETPELHWYAILLEDEDLGELGQSVHTNHLRSSTENADLDLSYKKLDSETSKVMIKTLKENKAISSLDISDNNISLALGKALMKVLETNNTLTSLNLRSTYLESEVLNHLMKILKSNKTRLADLNLSKNGDKVGKKGRLIIETLAKNTTLRTLNLSDNPIDWSDVRFIGLESNRTLENLDLSNSGITHIAVEKLKKYLIRSKKLKVLNLSSNNLTYQSERVIAEILSTNRTLRSLNLGSNKISSTIDSLERDTRTSFTGRTSRYSYDRNSALKVNNLAKALEKNKALKKLDLSSNYIRLEAGRSIAKALSINKCISELSLSDNGIVSELKDLLINILSNTNITSINLKSTKISSDMVISISELLRLNKTKLHTLNLSRNDVSSDAISNLIESLEENTSLRVLDLSNINKAGQIGKELERSLEKNKTLKVLNLSYSNVRSRAVNALAKALETNYVLSDLDLSNNNASMASLMKPLETNKALTRLNLSDIDLTLPEMENLANALKINNTLTHLYLSKSIEDLEIGKVLFEAVEENKKVE